MHKLDDDMRHLVFTEEKEKYPSQFALWLTVEQKLYMEMGPTDNDPMMMQCIVLDQYDARALLAELTGIISAMDDEEITPIKKTGHQLTIGINK